jgi:hypothetical protein
MWTTVLKLDSFKNKEAYMLALAADNSTFISDKIKDAIKNDNRKNVKNINAWNKQLVNTNLERLERKYPNIPDLKEIKERALKLRDSLESLNARDYTVISISEEIKGLLDDNKFKEIDELLIKKMHKRKSSHSIKIKNTVKPQIGLIENLLKSAIKQNIDALDMYYYDASDVEYDISNLTDVSDLEQHEPYIVLTKDTMTFADRIPPHIKSVVKEHLKKHTKDTKLKIGISGKFKPSILVTHLGPNILKETPKEIGTEYKATITEPRQVLDYLEILGKIGKITALLPGPREEATKRYNTIFANQGRSAIYIYPALRVILSEPALELDQISMNIDSHRKIRAVKFKTKTLLMDNWFRPRENIDNETVVIDENEIIPDIIDAIDSDLVVDWNKNYSKFNDLRNLYKLPASKRNRVLHSDFKGTEELYGPKTIKLHNDFMDLVSESMVNFFSEENYKILLQLEDDIKTYGIDAPKELADHFGLSDTVSEEVINLLHDILDNGVFDIGVKNLFTDRTVTDAGIMSRSGRRIDSKLYTAVKANAKRALDLKEGEEKVLNELVKDLDLLYDFIRKHFDTAPKDVYEFEEALQDLQEGQLDVDDFSPTQTTLSDILEMMAQISWLLGDGKVMINKKKLSDAIDKGDKKGIQKYIQEYKSDYTEVQELMVSATLEAIERIGKSPEHYNKMVKDKTTKNLISMLKNAKLIREI